MNRRQALSAIGSIGLGSHLANVAAPVVDFLLSSPSKNPNTAVRGLLFGHGQAVAELLDSHNCGWPYLHVLCHAFSVASMRAGGATDQEAIEWSVWGGIQDELFQQDWAQWYRRELHPVIMRSVDTDNERDTVFSYLWGTPNERKGASAKCKFHSGGAAWKQLRCLRIEIHLLIDACESAWQRSDETDNELGRQIGLRCPPFNYDEERLGWCKPEVNKLGILPETPEGPGTDREFGPFHPRHPGQGWQSHQEQQQCPWPLLDQC